MRTTIRNAIVNQLHDDGWTCDTHEPNPTCIACLERHTRTADRIMTRLQPTLDAADHREAHLRGALFSINAAAQRAQKEATR